MSRLHNLKLVKLCVFLTFPNVVLHVLQFNIPLERVTDQLTNQFYIIVYFMYFKKTHLSKLSEAFAQHRPWVCYIRATNAEIYG